MSKRKPSGLKRFEKFLVTLESKLQSASNSNNATLYLYQNDSRTCLFMLEALCRIYRKMHNNSRFEKLLITFKEFEDALGEIDYYDSLQQWAKKKSEVQLEKEFAEKYVHSLDKLQKILSKRKWLSFKKNKNKKIEKIRKGLNKVKWKKSKSEEKLFKQFLITACEKVITRSDTLDFNLLEEGIHEFRRNLRWLSIYSQSLLGVIQLKDDSLYDSLKYYLTDEIVKSRFNILPENSQHLSEIQIRKSLFWSMSYVIHEIGLLKDEGLIIDAVSHFYLSNGDSATIAREKAESLKAGRTLNEIKTLAQKLITRFQRDNIMNEMIEDFY